MKTQEDKLKLLKETELYYSENVLRRCTNSKQECFYFGGNNTKTESDGCAIGRLLPKELAKELDEEFKNNNAFSGVVNIFHRLPADLQEYGKSFLLKLQMFHDNSFHWDKNGLSQFGQTEYIDIYSKITNNLI